MKKLHQCCAGALVAALILLTGCQQAPEQPVVVDKVGGFVNTGTLPSSEPESAPAESKQPESSEETVPQKQVVYQDEFSSTDGSVSFSLDIHQNIIDAPMPVVMVSPHYFTPDDAQRIARVLFPNATFSNIKSEMTDDEYSKAEIQAKIDRWISYGNRTGFGGEDYQRSLEWYVEEYTLMMENAPDEIHRPDCNWQFQSASLYFDIPADPDDNDQLLVRVQTENIPYQLNISTRNKRDFKLNTVFVRPADGSSPWTVDYYYFLSVLCATRKPEEADLLAITKKAEQMLADFRLGDWAVDEAYVETKELYGDTEYMVTVKAVPVFEQVPAVRRFQLSNLRSEESYASNYYLSDAIFQFNVDGEVVNFEFYSPVNVDSVITRNAEVMEVEQLLQSAKRNFTLSDAYAYDYGEFIKSANEELLCHVDVTEIDYGLTRAKVPNVDEQYYYLPAVFFMELLHMREKKLEIPLMERRTQRFQSP